jgi:hypothetical protein
VAANSADLGEKREPRETTGASRVRLLRGDSLFEPKRQGANSRGIVCTGEAGESDRRHGGLCCGYSAAIKPGALAPRSAAAGLDSGTAAERSASMPFDGALGLLKAG